MTGPEHHRDDDAALAAEHVLGLLDAETAAACDRRLLQDLDYRDHYGFWAEHFVSLASNAPPVPPPAALRAAIQRKLFADQRQGLLRRLGLWQALAGGFVAAALVVVVSQSGLLQPEPTGPGMRAEVAAEDRSLVVQVAWDPSNPPELRISRLDGAPAAGRSLELWLIAGDAAPVSLGVLPDDREASITIPESLLGVLENAVLAVSDEPEGGSPIDGPTGAVLALGPITAI